MKNLAGIFIPFQCVKVPLIVFHRLTRSLAIASLGNDGAWSPFLVNVGTPPTPLQLLASTEIPETWVVVPLGCQGAALNCSDARGGIFDLDGSRTWSNKSGENSIYKINAEVNLQLDVNALYGFDTVQIGSPGGSNATVEQQVVAGLAEPELYLGSLGLHNRTVVFQPDQLQGQPSFIQRLSSTKQIPSLSYGFFAGASYRKGTSSQSVNNPLCDTNRIQVEPMPA